MLLAAGDNADCKKVAEALALAAVSAGSTDDVSVVVLKLGSA
jgi:serine/threonine protein phosphatase PrpC